MRARLTESQHLAAVGQATAIVGHALRNPLQAIATTTYLLQNSLTPYEAGQRIDAQKLLTTIDDQVRFMDDIVSNLQDYSKPLKVEPVETNVIELIRQILAAVGTPDGVQTSVLAREDLSNVVVDSRLLRQVITNLVTNAVQAIPQGGQLTVTCSREKDRLILSVRDNGQGIASEYIGRVFKPFFTTKPRGLGLGLAVCNRIVEAMGGTISVESKVTEGSCFTITVPIGSK